MKKHRSMGQKKKILLGLLWGSVGLILLAALFQQVLLLAAGFVVLGGFIVLSWVWWRCPACGAALARFGEQGDFCSRCGVAIDWDT